MGTPNSDMADPELRLRDMDLEGIDVAVLYPSLGLNFWAVTDPATATSLAAWLAELRRACTRFPRRVPATRSLPRPHDHPELREIIAPLPEATRREVLGTHALDGYALR
jgi:hypothetical protein